MSEKGILRALVRMGEIRDPYTAGHERRVAELGAAIGQRLKLRPESVQSIRLAGMLHDIGKIAVPVEILNRPGRLSPHEMGMIRTHSEVGFDILKDSDLPAHVAEMVLEHHERLDGTGYPHGKKNGDISIESRVLAVADVVESMISHRPYRPALGVDRAFDEIQKGSGTIYDADVTDACMDLFTKDGFALAAY
jgi:putative two-component system response regulator